MYNFYIIIKNFCNFFQNSLTPGDPWGGPTGPGGAPPGGVPSISTPRDNLNILRFWNILEYLFRHNKQKNWDRLSLGGPQANWGGVLGGVYIPKGPPRFSRSRFFASYA